MLGKRDEYPENDEVNDETKKKLKEQEESHDDESDIEVFVQTFNPDDFIIEDDGKPIQ